MKVKCPGCDVQWESAYGGTTCWCCDGYMGVNVAGQQVIGTWPFDNNPILGKTYHPPAAWTWSQAAERARQAMATQAERVRG